MSKSFGEKLRARRTNRGLTLDALAEKVGSTKAYIWQLENKKPARPSGELLLKLARELDVSPEFLIDDAENEPNQNHLQDALARGLNGRGISADDVDKLFKIADMVSSGKTPKRSK